MLGKLVITALVLLWALYLGLRGRRSSEGPKGTLDVEAIAGEMDDMNRKFLEGSEGRSPLDLVRIFNPEDLMLLRSLLDSSGIFSHVSFQNLNSLYPNIAISGHPYTVLTIYDDDLEDARKIVAEYIENRKAAFVREKSASISNVAEFLVGGPSVGSGARKAFPELLA